MSRLAVSVSALVVVNLAVSIVFGSQMSMSDWTGALTVAVLYGAVNLVPLNLPRGDSLQASCGVAVASVLLLNPHTAVLGAIGGVVLSAMSVRILERPLQPVLLDIARVPILVVFTSVLIRELGYRGAPDVSSTAFMLVAVAIAVLYLLLDLVTYGLMWAVNEGNQVWHSIIALIRLVGGMYAGQASVGIVLAVVFTPMGVAGIIVLVALMMVMKHAFALLLQIRTAYTKTVGVLATLAESAHSESRGHSERVSNIATDMGRRMHLRQSLLKRLGLAALLHDIGAVAADEDGEGDRHARVGAEIVEGVDFLRDVAPIVEAHHDDYSSVSSPGDVSLLAQTIRVASDYDIMVTVNDSCPHAALDRIQALAGIEYDPYVVAALRKSVYEKSNLTGSGLT